MAAWDLDVFFENFYQKKNKKYLTYKNAFKHKAIDLTPYPSFLVLALLCLAL